MNDKLKQILSNMKKYNAGIMFQEVFGFDPETEYDALVIAPGWKPVKILRLYCLARSVRQFCNRSSPTGSCWRSRGQIPLYPQRYNSRYDF